MCSLGSSVIYKNTSLQRCGQAVSDHRCGHRCEAGSPEEHQFAADKDKNMCTGSSTMLLQNAKHF